MLPAVLLSVVKLALTAALCLLIVFLVWLVQTVFVAPLRDPLGNLPGPEGSTLTSHLNQVSDPDISPIIHKDWTTNFGKTFRFQGFGKYDYRLMSFDLRVISHVLNSPLYEKPWPTRSLLSKFLGRGVFTAEGGEHALQRKIIGPAFTTGTIKDLTPIFFQKAEELCDQWTDLISQGPGPSSLTLDVNNWFARATFDVFGLTAFDYHFRALSDESEPLYAAFRRMFGVVDKKSVLHILFPNLENYWPDETTKTTRECLEIIHKAGAELVAAKKAVILSEKADVDKKDLLSLLIKSNLSIEPGKRLSDDDLLDQVSSFLFAGSDSTALATTWCFHFLSLNPEIQNHLRREILSISEHVSLGSVQSHDAIMTLPYLDAVVRESLRLRPPTHATLRAAMADDIIPISHPVILKNGRILENGEHIQIRKGSYVHIPIEGLNYDEDIWGRHSKEFNPDRWFSLPPNARPPTYPGIANVMTFSFGPHSCPGYKFSICEIKAFVATLLSQFTFQAVEGQTVLKVNGILTRPLVKGQSGLPMVVGLQGH